jgi:hypothetical protein
MTTKPYALSQRRGGPEKDKWKMNLVPLVFATHLTLLSRSLDLGNENVFQ